MKSHTLTQHQGGADEQNSQHKVAPLDELIIGRFTVIIKRQKSARYGRKYFEFAKGKNESELAANY